MKGAEPDLSAATFQIHDESHTIGNALRWMLMKKYARQNLLCLLRTQSTDPVAFSLNVARRLSFVDTGGHCSFLFVYSILAGVCGSVLLLPTQIVPAFSSYTIVALSYPLLSVYSLIPLADYSFIVGQCTTSFGKSYSNSNSDVWYVVSAPVEVIFTTHCSATNWGFTDKLSSLTALLTALNDLDSLCETVEDAYNTSLQKDKYERWEEKSWV